MIKFIKLKNTEELVGEVEDNGAFIQVKYPAKITTKYIDDTIPKTIVLPYILHSKNQSCNIEKNEILFLLDASDSLSEYYSINIVSNYKTKE